MTNQAHDIHTLLLSDYQRPEEIAKRRGSSAEVIRAAAAGRAGKSLDEGLSLLP
jgi:hypothetical protein